MEVSVRENFEMLCSRCHAASAASAPVNVGSGIPVARDFTDTMWQSEVSDSQIRRAIRDGVTKGESQVMPAWGEILDDDDISALVELIRDFGEESDN